MNNRHQPQDYDDDRDTPCEFAGMVVRYTQHAILFDFLTMQEWLPLSVIVGGTQDIEKPRGLAPGTEAVIEIPQWKADELGL